MVKIKLRTLHLNLLISQANRPKFLSKLLRYLLSSGRFLVVVVEIVVITAFVYRYKLDSDLLNLQDQIKEQIPYVESLQKDEAIIRQAQFILSTTKQARSDSPNWTGILTKISSLTPKSAKLTNINLDRTQQAPKTIIKISGITPGYKELAAFINVLKKDPIFTNITLANISSEKTQIIFTVTGTLNQAGGTVK